MNLEQKVGFDKVREMISNKCSTQYAVKRTEEESISTDQEHIRKRLVLTEEMRLICMFEDSFPQDGFVDVKDFLVPLSAESTYIDIQSLVRLRTALDTIKKIISFFKNGKEDIYPNLKKMSEKVEIYPEVNRRIDLIIDKYGEIRDNASVKLISIRQSLKEKEGAVSKRISAILKKAQAEGVVDKDVSISIRDGKTLIPVSSGNKKKIAGLVYDESSSGKTSFIEPLEVVELNNQVRELKFEEQREILRILVEFTDFLRPYLPELIISAEYMGEVDFIRAKAFVALDIIAGMPIISQSGDLLLRKARNPLLERALKKEKKEIVPLSISLNKDKHILLISGPNAGGKSVCLKTVGLLQYMFQWGMLIPTSEISEMMVFNDIYIDIGDDQSLENDLSTYSSHLKNMKEIVTHVGEKSLVLIDEFGSGTEPVAGGAIAEAVLAELDNAGAYGVITTHYTNLKLYANNSRGVINGAMLFDTVNIMPLFKLETGLPGNSFAFELARKIGLPEQIVKNAEERAGSEFVDIERHLRKIAKNKRVLDEKLAHIKNTDKVLDNLTEKYHKELSEIKALKKNILDQARNEAKEILSETNRKIEQTIREIREAEADKEKTKALRRDMESFVKNIDQQREDDETDKKIALKMEQILARKERERKRKEARMINGSEGNLIQAKKEKIPEGPLKAGDKVKIKDSDLIGEIIMVSSKSVSVSIGDIISKMSSSKVERISNQQYKDTMRSTVSSKQVSYDSSSISQRKLDFRPEIDIRGERLNDALEIVTDFIDDAVMVGMSEVKILHGKGNGILREEIRKYIKTLSVVSSFKDAAIEHGGSGITIVYLET